MQSNLEKVDATSRREIADQHLRPTVELVGDDIEITVAVQVECDRGARAERAHHGQVAGGVHPAGPRHRLRMGTGATEGMARVRAVALEREPDLLCDAARPRLDPKHEFAR